MSTPLPTGALGPHATGCHVTRPQFQEAPRRKACQVAHSSDRCGNSFTGLCEIRKPEWCRFGEDSPSDQHRMSSGLWDTHSLPPSLGWGPVHLQSPQWHYSVCPLTLGDIDGGSQDGLSPSAGTPSCVRQSSGNGWAIPSQGFREPCLTTPTGPS